MGEVFGFEFEIPKARALWIFEQHLLPFMDKFNDLEKAMAISYLKDPEKAVPEIVKRYKIESFDQLVDLLSSPETPESAKAFLRAIKETLEEGTFRGFNTIFFRRKFLPGMPRDVEELKEIKDYLDKLKERKATKILKTETLGSRKMTRSGGELYIYNKLASKALGRKVAPGEELSFEEAEKCVNWLYEHWKELGFFDAEQRGLIWEDKIGFKHWIWERYIEVWTGLPSAGPEEAQKLREIKNYLEELKQKGADKFLSIKAGSWEGIYWDEDRLKMFYRLGSEALGREVKERERLTLEEAEKIVDYLLESWQKV